MFRLKNRTYRISLFFFQNADGLAFDSAFSLVTVEPFVFYSDVCLFFEQYLVAICDIMIIQGSKLIDRRLLSSEK